jgi:hypothetical protein
MNPIVRAHRILKSMRRFKVTLGATIPVYLKAVPLAPMETLIGVYENNLETISRCVAVTDHRLLVEDGDNWLDIVYEDITDVEIPVPSEITEESAVLRIRLRNGKMAFVPIRGQNGRFYDIYEFARFVSRANEDALRQLKQPENS